MQETRDNAAASKVFPAGTIPLCPHQGCGHTCCDFAEGNYIVLYPGEIAAALQGGQSVEHLEITDDDSGGQRAICKAVDRTTCDGGYKPLDCASYPFFPTIDPQGKVNAALKGAKCPLVADQILDHQAWVTKRWTQLLQSTPLLARWLGKVRLIGYTRIIAAED